MLVRGLGAFVRAFVMCVVVAFPSLALSQSNVVGFDLFLILAVIAGITIFVEYLAKTPSFIEFRLAPPYNRYRMCCLVLVATYIVIAMNPNDGAGPVFDIVGGFTGFAELVADALRIPSEYFVKAFGPIDEDQYSVLKSTASGTFVVAFLSALLMAVILWLQSWPLTREGFNLWPNMPSFNTRAGSKTEGRMIRFAILSVVLAILFPFAMPAAMSYARNWMLADFTQNSVLVFWLITIWALVPAMLFLRALALLKVAYLINHLRKLQ